MKLNINKKTLNFLLLSIAFTIWIVVFLKIILPDNPDESDISTQPVRKEKTQSKKIADVYDPKVQNDPFITPFNKKHPVIRQKTPPPPKREVLETLPPQIRLLGIVKDERGKLAIIQFEDGTTKFMRENEEVENIKIIQILEREVEYQFEKRKINLYL